MIHDLPPDLIQQVRAKCVTLGVTPTASQVTELLRQLSPVSTRTELLDLVDQVLAELHGLGPLEELLGYEDLTDILINRFDEVWIDRGMGLEQTEVSWQSEEELRNFATRIASLGHRRLDESQPFVDLRLDNGIRFHATIPPLAIAGTTLSLRIPKSATLTMPELIELKTINREGLGILQRIIDRKVSFLISGGTGSGKTTLLAALLSLIPIQERIVVIEDSSELEISHPHVVSLQSRLANVEGLGEIPLSTLVRQSLRMRPDRIVIGEVRGVEITDFLIALNTGHQGCAGTIHANSGEDVPTRIEALGLLGGLPSAAIHAQLCSAIQVVIELSRNQMGVRQVSKIGVLVKNTQEKAEVITAVEFGSQTLVGPGFTRLIELVGELEL
jgi:pilus assembly protein CpaF